MSHPTITRGVWGVVATPFTGSTFDLDEPSLTRLVAHYDAIDADGLTVLGVFGEAACLSDEERQQVLEVAVESSALPLVVGATSLRASPLIEEIERIRAVVPPDRLAAVMVQANSANPRVLADHLSAAHDATQTPLVVQDYPLASGVTVSTTALVEAVQNSRGVVAVKAEAPPTPASICALTAALDIPVFGGLGGMWLLDELAAGAAGAMTGFSFPEGLQACVSAWSVGGYQAARSAFAAYLPLVNFEQQAGIALAIRKECLRQRGLIQDSAVRPPAASLPDALLGTLVSHLQATRSALEGRA